ncbi:MAG: DUF2993 domain-containing protein [Actinomycetota bacterium]|nr:DUF2993 domain-containing protein [Actinomycetota bacterium]
MRKLLVALAVLLVVYVAADVGARFWAQSWVGGQLQRSLHLSKTASVSFGGVLFIPEVASGHIPSASVHADSFTSGGVHFESATLDLRDIRFSPSQVFLSKHEGSIRARSGSGSVAMTGADITEALRSQGVPVTVRLAGGEVRVSGDSVPGEVAVQPAIENGSLVLRSGGVSVSLKLPEVVPGLTYRGVRIDGDLGELLFTVSNVTFIVPRRS